MKKFSEYLIIALVSLTFIQLAGCKKKDIKPPKAEDLCDIRSIEYNYYGNLYSEATFTYNMHGDPLTITVLPFTATYNANVIFLYDQYHRLTDFVEPYNYLDPANLPSEISFEKWIRLTYADENPASMPVADTLRSFGIKKDGQFFTATPGMEINNYNYDSKGRIIRVKNQYTATSSTNILTYSYNTYGNLVLPNVTYDDKISFRRTNKIWMFLDRNYSENNEFIATGYNDKGLPTKILNSYVAFIGRTFNLSLVNYSCQVKSAAE